MKTKKELHDTLLSYFDNEQEYQKDIYSTVNDDYYTLADMIARQYINNNCDGFDMFNIYEAYCYVIDNLDDLKAHNMISETASNNSGFTLWKNWGIS